MPKHTGQFQVKKCIWEDLSTLFSVVFSVHLTAHFYNTVHV